MSNIKIKWRTIIPKKNTKISSPRKRFRKVNISKLTRFSFLPSIFTLFNLLLGYLALVQIFKGEFINAVYFIAVSVVMDGFDGTIARLTKTESNFGMQLDSLVDAVTFGFVTAVLIYTWGFRGIFPQNGKIVGFIFLSAGIIRLARFNVLKEAEAFPANVFIGLPIPLAAISVLSIVLIYEEPINNKYNALFFSFYVIIISFLMISNIKYRTLKKINSKYSLLTLFLLAILVASCIMYPMFAIPIISLLYVISPIFYYVPQRLKKMKKKAIQREKAQPVANDQTS